MTAVILPSHDVLSTIIDQTPVSRNHKGLIDALTMRGMDGVKYMKQGWGEFSKDMRVFDSQHNQVATDYREWMKTEFAAVGGDAKALYDKYEKSGYLISEEQGYRHYFALPYGDAPGAFFQFEIEISHEVIVRKLLSRHWHWYSDTRSLEQLIDERDSPIDVPVEVRGLSYRLVRTTDIRRFLNEKNAAYKAELAHDAQRSIELTNVRSGAVRIATLGELHPEAYNPSVNCAEFRMLEDWERSSAGASGALLYDNWYFEIRDYTATNGKRNFGAIPQWTTTLKLAEVVAKPRNLSDYALYDKLQRLDKRVGVPFAWYFFMLHGNRVHSWAGQRILKAVENGAIVMPDQDYLVLRQWYDMPYGF